MFWLFRECLRPRYVLRYSRQLEFLHLEGQRDMDRDYMDRFAPTNHNRRHPQPWEEVPGSGLVLHLNLLDLRQQELIHWPGFVSISHVNFSCSLKLTIIIAVGYHRPFCKETSATFSCQSFTPAMPGDPSGEYNRIP